jgi:sugar phosphate isomerase/epimerase
MQQLIDKIQINIPFTMLYDTYLDAFLRNGLNPEIGLDATALERFSVSEFNRIAAMFHKRSRTVTLHGPFIDLSAGSPDPAVRGVTRRRFEQLLELVPLFKPKSVVCHAGYDAKRYDYLREVWIENSLDLWCWLAKQINAAGSRLMLENVFEDGPEDILVLFKRLRKENVGLCLDTGHLTAFGKTGLAAWLESLGAYLGQLHLHDNHGKQDEHLALGRGSIDFQALFMYLKKRKNSYPIITLEPHSEADLWPSLAYLAEFWS